MMGFDTGYGAPGYGAPGFNTGFGAPGFMPPPMNGMGYNPNPGFGPLHGNGGHGHANAIW
jgi:hypothetical protein